MAKSLITGTASSPSNEEFQKRVARLAEMPVQLSTSKKRQNRFAKWTSPRQQSEQSADGSNPSDDAD